VRGEPAAVRVQHDDPAGEQLAEHRRDVVHAAAVQHHPHEPVVRGRGLGDVLVRGGQGDQRRGRRRLPARLHQRHGRQRGQRPEQRHLVPAEWPGGAVGHEEHADEAAADQQGRTADRDQALLADRRVDLGRVPEALVRGVVGAPVRAVGLGN
jgi:hypothetical protein